MISPGGTLGIVELVDVCRAMYERNDALFRESGAWVTDEADPALQRWFAVGSHRHAWHAELWQDRLPQIPLDVGAPDAPPSTGGVDGYRAELNRLLADLDALESRIDPDLDPSTARVITLVRADLLDLLDRAPD